MAFKTVKTDKKHRINDFSTDKVIYRTVYNDGSKKYIINGNRKVIVHKKQDGKGYIAPYTRLK